jgi:hypothetical protein
MKGSARRGAGLRLILIFLVWGLIPTSAWAHSHPEKIAGEHSGSRTSAHHGHSSPGHGARMAQWQVAPGSCHHCDAGRGCEWRDCTTGGVPLLASAPPAITFAGTDRSPGSWRPDRPLAENPTPPIPPPLPIL